MKLTTGKRLLFATIAFLLCFSCISCSKQEEKVTSTEEAALTATATVEKEQEIIPAPQTIVEEEFKDEIPEDELLGKIGAWRGWAGSGTLTTRDHQLIRIDSKKDLDPYREYLSNFTAADEKKILADKEGICVLVELMDINQHTMFGTSSIVRGGSAITIIISVDEVEEELPSHTFFLLYFPEEYYNGEVIDLAF